MTSEEAIGLVCAGGVVQLSSDDVDWDGEEWNSVAAAAGNYHNGGRLVITDPSSFEQDTRVQLAAAGKGKLEFQF